MSIGTTYLNRMLFIVMLGLFPMLLFFLVALSAM